ncbi:MAG: response regulator, partial [Gemmatimonadota bacterium]
KRLQQVLKNLLSNAFKFTESGRVALSMRPVTNGWSKNHELLDSAKSVVAFMVTDTGIGIPKDKQAVIFEAFQQADGTTSRKYGGTGLGLSISRQIARLLGGELLVESREGQGSTFTLFLPILFPSDPNETPYVEEPEHVSDDFSPTAISLKQLAPRALRRELEPLLERTVSDDRAVLRPGDRVMLIAEDDADFAGVLLDLARQAGFKGLVAGRADKAITLLRDYSPSAVILDLRLPDADGWTVLDRVKHDVTTRHIPVQIISVDENYRRGIRLGARDHLRKPASREELTEVMNGLSEFVERPIRRLLVVEDDQVQRQSIIDLIAADDVEFTAVGSGEEALDALGRQRYDCMVLDLGLPDMTGLQLIRRIKRVEGHRWLPTVVYTGKDLGDHERSELRSVADAVIIKDASSPEQLIDDTALYLHRVTARLPERQRRVVEELHRISSVLAGRSVLIVDDDVRNIFALTTFLERRQMRVLYAESGQEGIDLLEAHPEVEVVLMDIMMPEMDGYQTIQAIRRVPKFQKLPIIALTAKAMKGDRERCIEAGASDYIAKPVDIEQLMSMMRVWVAR